MVAKWSMTMWKNFPLAFRSSTTTVSGYPDHVDKPVLSTCVPQVLILLRQEHERSADVLVAGMVSVCSSFHNFCSSKTG